jgi:hypothetical protein
LFTFSYLLEIFCIDDNSRSISAIIDDQIISPFGIDEMTLPKIHILQEVRHQILVKFFGLVVFGGVEELYQIALERLDVNAVWLDLEESFVEGEAGGEWSKGHGGGNGWFLFRRRGKVRKYFIFKLDSLILSFGIIQLQNFNYKVNNLFNKILSYLSPFRCYLLSNRKEPQ